MATFITAILTFFLFPSIGFFLGLLALSVVYTIATERDTHGFAVFATILGIGLFWKSLAVLGAIAWPFILIGVGAYLLIGGVWSVFRWLKYCQSYIANHPGNTESHYQSKLKPSEHKSRLIGWIVYWPWSLIWNIAGDTLTAIYDALANVYQKTANAVIKRAMGRTNIR